jgi:pentatricopeptide repeat protein
MNMLVLSQGMSPDVVTYTTLMKAFMRVKRFEKVLRLYIYSSLLMLKALGRLSTRSNFYSVA